MRPLVWAVGLTVLGSLGGVLVASALLFFNDKARDKVVPWLVSYAVGTLLGVALLVILPEALAHLAPLPHPRLRGAWRRGADGDHRHRLSQLS